LGTLSWKITNTFISYTTHGNIKASMDYLYEGPLQTSTSGQFIVNLSGFDPTNVLYEGQGGAVCNYASLKVTCTGILTRLHITFDYYAGAGWTGAYFSNTSDFANSFATDMTYIVKYASQFNFVSASPTPASSLPGQVTWLAPASHTIGGVVTFIDPALLPNKSYLPLIIR
jgi:hypothetical protein